VTKTSFLSSYEYENFTKPSSKSMSCTLISKFKDNKILVLKSKEEVHGARVFMISCTKLTIVERWQVVVVVLGEGSGSRWKKEKREQEGERANRREKKRKRGVNDVGGGRDKGSGQLGGRRGKKKRVGGREIKLGLGLA